MTKTEGSPVGPTPTELMACVSTAAEGPVAQVRMPERAFWRSGLACRASVWRAEGSNAKESIRVRELLVLPTSVSLRAAPPWSRCVWQALRARLRRAAHQVEVGPETAVSTRDTSR